MMKAIKQLFTTLLAFGVMTTFALAGKGWETDIDAAIVTAKKQNKAVMVEFTGSDWCPPCIMMEEKVFTQSEFTNKASEKYVLVKIDIPKKDPKLSEQNRKVMGKYGVRGVPTVILMDKEGKEFDRFTASQYPDITKFLAHLDSALEKKDLD